MLSKIVLGTVQFGLDYGVNNKNGQITREEVYRILKFCKNSGIRYIDTAAAYGTSEVVLGDLLSSHFKAGDFEITTKFKYEDNKDLYHLTNQSLHRLNKPFVESQLFHSFADYQRYSQFPKPEAVHKWGVSVYTNTEISTAIEDPEIKIIQCPFNLLDNESRRGDLLRKAKSKGIEIQVRSIFLQGLFFMETDNLVKGLLPFKPFLERINNICLANGLTVHELAIGYCASKNYIDKLLIGVDSLNQLESNVNALNRVISEGVYDMIDNMYFEHTQLLNPSNW